MSTATEEKKDDEGLAEDAPPEIPSSPADATIHQRMVAILSELPAIGRGEYNEQQKFHFRGYDSMMNALNPLLGKHGVYFIPEVLERITGERTTGSGKTMYEVNLHIRYTFFGLLGDSVQATGWGEGTDLGDKATNKATTAAIKYVLDKVFAISTKETSDADGEPVEETVRDRGESSSTGGSQRKPRQTAQEKRAPKSWPEMQERLAHGYDAGAPTDFSAFVRHLAMHRFNSDIGDVFGTIGPGKLEEKDWKELFTESAKALDRLFEIYPPGGAMPPTIDQMRQAFLDVSKIELAGPTSPAERPAPAQVGPSESAEDPDAVAPEVAAESGEPAPES